MILTSRVQTCGLVLPIGLGQQFPWSSPVPWDNDLDCNPNTHGVIYISSPELKAQENFFDSPSVCLSLRLTFTFSTSPEPLDHL
jgi:hypothetical protein